MGYHRAGFDVIGIDRNPMPDYPFQFIQADAVDVASWPLRFDAIHASPPCQVFSTVTPNRHEHVNLIAVIRDRLFASGVPYVIENVAAARPHLRNPVMLCGSSFRLHLRRHRLFETNWPCAGKRCMHEWQQPRFRSLNNSMRTKKLSSVVGVHGNLQYEGELRLRQIAMGIDWLPTHPLSKAIPPAYTEHIGRQLLRRLQASP